MLEHHARASADESAEHDALAYATDGRTDVLTQKYLRDDENSPPVTRAGGAERFIAETLGLGPKERAPRIRAGAREPISPWIRRLVRRRDNYQCQRCGASPIARGADRRDMLEVDHITPWSAGGSDRTDNLRAYCHKCNTERSNYLDGTEKPTTPIVRADNERLASALVSLPVEIEDKLAHTENAHR